MNKTIGTIIITPTEYEQNNEHDDREEHDQRKLQYGSSADLAQKKEARQIEHNYSCSVKMLSRSILSHPALVTSAARLCR